jgi:threonine dehydratase
VTRSIPLSDVSDVFVEYMGRPRPTIGFVPPLERVRAAAERARPYVLRTPLLAVGPNAHLKLECLQPTGSFKVRGFFAQALLLPEAERRRGLLTVSAGNAAQACAYVADRLGVPCRTLMFDTAPPTKIAGVKRWGGQPFFLPREELLAWMGREGWRDEPELFVHPFAGEELMAGHGGIGLEIVEALPQVARVIVPVGGGGLISGVASALKGLRPEVEVIGVQSSGYPMWPRSFDRGEHVPFRPETIADGTTGPWSEAMYERMRALVDRWIEVPEARLRRAVAELAADHKVVAEGAGALPFAALEQIGTERPTVAVVSGGNVDLRLLGELLIELAEARAASR